MVICKSELNSYTGEVTAGTGTIAPPLNIADGSLCFDFANTLDARRAAQQLEGLTSYPDLVGWAGRVGLVETEQAARLLEQAEADPPAADGVLRLAIELREAIYRAFETIAADELPYPADLDLIRQAYANGVAGARLVPSGSRHTWDWAASDTLDWPLGPIAQSAVALLLSDDLDRVKTCNADACGWIFLDTSKNGSRRWCSMETCGSRMKMRRHYARKKASRTEDVRSTRPSA
jgi:predicted RNA-binding Zn ribbon-like protein